MYFINSGAQTIRTCSLNSFFIFRYLYIEFQKDVLQHLSQAKLSRMAAKAWKKSSNENKNVFRTLKEMISMSEIVATDFLVYCAKICIENNSEFNKDIAEKNWNYIEDKEEYSSLFLKLKEKSKRKKSRTRHTQTNNVQNLEAAETATVSNNTVILPTNNYYQEVHMNYYPHIIHDGEYPFIYEPIVEYPTFIYNPIVEYPLIFEYYFP